MYEVIVNGRIYFRHVSYQCCLNYKVRHGLRHATIQPMRQMLAA